MVRVTGNFTSESPLPEVVRAALLAAFDQGWADPKKISQSAGRAAILRNHALENIAAHLGISPVSIDVLGEPALGHFLAIAGHLRDELSFAYAAIDKGKIRAVARSHKGAVIELGVDSEGLINSAEIPRGCVLSLQLANGETGVVQDAEKLSSLANYVCVDATSSGSRITLPEKWDTALFDAKSWNGPAGLAILAINNPSHYRYPLPHIAPIKSPGTYSLPLLIAASVALENFATEDLAIRTFAISELSQIQGVRIVAPHAPATAQVFSLTVSDISSEELVRKLAQQGIDADSGSACSPADLQPSHVLAAMGYPTDGHLQITLHPQTTRLDIEQLAQALKSVAS